MIVFIVGICISAVITYADAYYTIRLEYKYSDGSIAHDPYVAVFPENEEVNVTVSNPIIPGYKPMDSLDENAVESETTTLSFTLTENHTITVYYVPDLVHYKVRYFKQNIRDDLYTEDLSLSNDYYERTGYTGEYPTYLEELRFDGFTTLFHEPDFIAADGSTVFMVYYDRNYYLINFDLDGGYGVEPVYAKYGSLYTISEPHRLGYTFAGWHLADEQGHFIDNDGNIITQAQAETEAEKFTSGTVPDKNVTYKENTEMTIKRTAALAIAIFLCMSSFIAHAADSYLTIDGFVFEITEGTAVIHDYDDRSADVVIPEKLLVNVEVIDDYTFFEDKGITSVSFEKSKRLKRIGVNAFYGCTGLKSLELPESLNELGFGAFQNCENLGSVALQCEVASIPSQCFLGCKKLNGVVLPDTLTEISSHAFSGCGSLSDITIPSGVTKIADDAFSGCGSLRIFCDEGSYAQAYAEAHGIECVLISAYPDGDANMDGKFNISDATFIQKSLVGIKQINSNLQKKLADTNRDGRISVRDATNIQMYLAGITDEL
ncbi:MAG: leucine-rich repeat protein [Ruminococcus sp.]|nr:leucine-rich repeat protein [Ruminococcus sp.]